MSCSGFRAGGFGNLDGHAEKCDVIRRSRSTLPHGSARSTSADHGETVFRPLYSGCTARRGASNRMLYKTHQFLHHSSHHSTLTFGVGG